MSNRDTRLAISAAPSAIGGAAVLLALFSLLGRRVFRLSPGAALAGGALATALHFASELWHQSGHARAAAQTGYPMSGVRLWGALGTSLYPCLLYTSPSPRDRTRSRMPSSACKNKANNPWHKRLHGYFLRLNRH